MKSEKILGSFFINIFAIGILLLIHYFSFMIMEKYQSLFIEIVIIFIGEIIMFTIFGRRLEVLLGSIFIFIGYLVYALFISRNSGLLMWGFNLVDIFATFVYLLIHIIIGIANYIISKTFSKNKYLIINLSIIVLTIISGICIQTYLNKNELLFKNFQIGDNVEIRCSVINGEWEYSYNERKKTLFRTNIFTNEIFKINIDKLFIKDKEYYLSAVPIVADDEEVICTITSDAQRFNLYSIDINNKEEPKLIDSNVTNVNLYKNYIYYKKEHENIFRYDFVNKKVEYIIGDMKNFKEYKFINEEYGL